MLVGAVLVMGLIAPPAAAHSTLERSIPEPGERVEAPLAEIELQFLSEVRNLSVVLIAPDGVAVAGVVRMVDGRKARYGVAELDQAGEYVVRYDLLSGDGDPASSGYAFSYAGSGSGSNGLVWLGLVAGLVALGGGVGLWGRRVGSR